MHLVSSRTFEPAHWRIKKGSKQNSKQKSVQYKDKPNTEEVVGEFLEESDVAEWMHELAGLIKKSIERDILDDLVVPGSDLWRLLTTTHRAYAKKYERYKKSPSMSSRKQIQKVFQEPQMVSPSF